MKAIMRLRGFVNPHNAFFETIKRSLRKSRCLRRCWVQQSSPQPPMGPKSRTLFCANPHQTAESFFCREGREEGGGEGFNIPLPSCWNLGGGGVATTPLLLVSFFLTLKRTPGYELGFTPWLSGRPRAPPPVGEGSTQPPLLAFSRVSPSTTVPCLRSSTQGDPRDSGYPSQATRSDPKGVPPGGRS